MDSAEDRLVRAALQGRLPSLDGMPQELDTAGWRSLVLLDEQLPPASAQFARVQGMRRRNFYSTQIASTLAATLCAQLADLSPAVFGDLSLAVAHCERAGDRSVDYLAIRVDRNSDTQRLAAVLSAIPGSSGTIANRQLVRTTVQGMHIGLHRAWPVLMAPTPAALDASARVVETTAGSIPVVSDPIEVVRVLSTAHHAPADLSWLLDLAAISATPETFEAVAQFARRAHRGTVVGQSWVVAHEFGIAPAPPAMPEPFMAGLGSRLALSSNRYSRAVGNRLLRFA